MLLTQSIVIKILLNKEVVNGYAKAINEAIDHLEYKDADYTKSN